MSKRVDRWSEQLKERVVKAREEGNSWAKISKLLDIPETSARDIVKRSKFLEIFVL